MFPLFSMGQLIAGGLPRYGVLSLVRERAGMPGRSSYIRQAGGLLGGNPAILAPSLVPPWRVRRHFCIPLLSK